MRRPSPEAWLTSISRRNPVVGALVLEAWAALDRLRGRAGELADQATGGALRSTSLLHVGDARTEVEPSWARAVQELDELADRIWTLVESLGGPPRRSQRRPPEKPAP